METLKRMRTVWIHLALVFFGVLLVVGIGEIWVRLILPEASGQTGEMAMETAFRSSSLLGWEHVPGAEKVEAKEEYQVTIRFNTKGLRDREYSYEKTPGTFRILVLGDSFTEGMGVRREEIYTEQLERRLNEMSQGMRYEVINAGTRGYGLDQYLIYLRSYGLYYQPDIVLVGLYIGNDILSAMRQVEYNHPKPYFALQGERLVPQQFPVPDFSTRAIEFAPAFKERTPRRTRFLDRTTRPVRSVLGRYSKLYAFVTDKLKRIPSVAYALEQVGLTSDIKGLAYVRELKDGLFGVEYTPRYERGWTLGKRIIEEMNQICRDARAKLILFLIPMKEQVTEEGRLSVLEVAAVMGVERNQLDFEKPNRLLVALGGEKNIDVIDPLPAFWERAQQGRSLYYRLDKHLTAEGHRKAAELIYEHLVNHHLVPIHLEP